MLTESYLDDQRNSQDTLRGSVSLMIQWWMPVKTFQINLAGNNTRGVVNEKLLQWVRKGKNVKVEKFS